MLGLLCVTDQGLTCQAVLGGRDTGECVGAAQHVQVPFDSEASGAPHLRTGGSPNPQELLLAGGGWATPVTCRAHIWHKVTVWADRPGGRVQTGHEPLSQVARLRAALSCNVQVRRFKNPHKHKENQSPWSSHPCPTHHSRRGPFRVRVFWAVFPVPRPCLFLQAGAV